MELQEGKNVIYGDLIYVLNEKDKTASVIDHKCNVSSITIPRYITVNSSIYTVTSIADRSFIYSRIKSIHISEFSEIRSIGNDAFFESYIESIELPSQLIDFKEDWNNGINFLKEIKVIENTEKNIKLIDDKFLVGKSDRKSDTFDVLLLALRNINDATIPSYIKRIGTCAFQFCVNLNEIKIQKNSELQSIDNSAFYNSSIKCIEIPSSLIELKKYWCSFIDDKVEFKIIKNGEENIKFFNEKFLIGKTDRKSDIFDILYFTRRDIEEATIPSFIKRIGSYAFSNCDRLKTVNIPNDSILESIGEYSFFCSSIEAFNVPSHVKEICDNAFCACRNIKTIKFKENSELQFIGSEVFYESSIECIDGIPTSVKTFKNDWCIETPELKEIKLIKNKEESIKFINNLLVGKTDLKTDDFDVVLFAPRDIKEVTIPKNIKQIGSSAFSNCKQLTSVLFESDSKLQKICENAFYESSIDSISIPSSVIEIDQYALSCNNLRNVTFQEDSKLEILKQDSLFLTPIEEICFPSHLKEISENLFQSNAVIKRLKFQKNSELRTICRNAFKWSSIESIEIPSNIVEFKKGWCYGISKLKDIKVIKNGDENIKFIEKSKFLVGKSDLKSDVFDVIYLVMNDVEKATIPPHIKRIATHAFNNCKHLFCVLFQEDSELQSIDTSAFLSTPISSISLPAKITEIGCNAFCECENLEIVEFSSKLSFELTQQSLMFDIKHDVIFMVSCI